MQRPLLLLFLCLTLSVLNAIGQDLIITSYSGPKTIVRYAEIQSSVVMKNAGIVATASNEFTTEFYLSSDTILSVNDKKLGFTYLQNFAAGQEKIVPCNCTTDVLPGDYFLLINVDKYGSIPETDETNNIFVVPGFLITASDADWELTEISFADTSGNSQDILTGTFSFNNNGPTNLAGSVRTTFLISTDPTLDDTDYQFFYNSARVRVSGPDAYQDVPFTVYMPSLSPGNYFVIAVLDNDRGQSEYLETDESNNILVTEISIGLPDYDLQFAEISLDWNNGTVGGHLSISNNGTTGVGFTEILAYLSTSPTIDPLAFHVESNQVYETIDTPSGYFGAGGQGHVYPYFMFFDDLPAGTYYLILQIDPYESLAETDRTNNTYISPTPFLVISPPTLPSFELSNGSFTERYDNTDTSLDAKMTFRNTGQEHFSALQSYQITITDVTSTTVYSATRHEFLDFAVGDSVVTNWTFQLNNPLPLGEYSMIVSCLDDSECYTNDLTIPLSIDQKVSALSGTIQGVDGTPMTKGSLFLYRKNSNGVTSFINKIIIDGSSDFTFQIDTSRHTLYFIPNPVLFSSYVPTILGKTVTLSETSFVRLNDHLQVLLEVLKINPLGNGSKSISGTLSENTNTSGRTKSNVTVAGVTVILLSQTGEPVAVTTTDESGYYEFINLPEGHYQVLVAFGLDEISSNIPTPADVTIFSAKIDFKIGSEDAVPTTFKVQEITFESPVVRNYGDESFELAALTDSGLPVIFESSNPLVASVIGKIVTIHAAGSITITAKQPGNLEFYPANNIQRQLLIAKASQEISFEIIPEKDINDPSFLLEPTASSGLAITYSSSNSSVATVSGNSVTITGEGTCTITATQPGNANYYPAESKYQTLRVTKPKLSQNITFESLPEKKYGDPTFKVQAMASSNLTITYTSSNPSVASVSGNTVTVRAAGNTLITAFQNGNTNYYPAAPKAQMLIVAKADQQINAGGFPQMVTMKIGSFYLGASATSGLPVSYSSSDTSVVRITGNKVTVAHYGSVNITMTQSGNELYNGVTDSKPLYISRELQTLTFDPLAESHVGDEPILLHAIASSGLPVSYSSSNTQVASIQNNILTIKNEGTTIITASQSGNELFEPTALNQDLIVTVVTSLVSDDDEQQISISPNPVSSWATFHMNKGVQTAPGVLTIYDLKGQLVFEEIYQPATQFSVNVESIRSGFYCAVFTQGKVKRSKRFIKL